MSQNSETHFVPWRNEYIRVLKSKAQAKHLRPLQRSTGRCATVYAAGGWLSSTEFSVGTGRLYCRRSCRASLMACGIPRWQTSRPTPRLLACGGSLFATRGDAVNSRI